MSSVVDGWKPLFGEIAGQTTWAVRGFQGLRSEDFKYQWYRSTEPRVLLAGLLAIMGFIVVMTHGIRDARCLAKKCLRFYHRLFAVISQ